MRLRLRHGLLGFVLLVAVAFVLPFTMGGFAAWSALSVLVVALPGGAPRLLLLGVALFTRLAPEEVPTSTTRARILVLLRQRPGLGITDVRTALVLGWGTAVHHLNLLERTGHVVSRDAGRHRRFFVAQESPERRRAVCVLSNDLNRRLLLEIDANPRVNQTQLCLALGLSAPMAHKAIGRLRREGLVQAVREWRTVRYSVAPAGSAMVRAAQEAAQVPGTVGPMVPA